MATISLIQGTDSLSASRVTLNDNFTAINDELALVTGILDPTTSSLSDVNLTIDAASINIDGGSAASFASTGNVLAIDTDVDGLLKINKGATYSSDTVANMPSTYIDSVYFVTGPAALSAAEEGQEITVISQASSSIPVTGNIAGYAQILLSLNGSVTLRHYSGVWYVISASPVLAQLSA